MNKTKTTVYKGYKARISQEWVSVEGSEHARIEILDPIGKFKIGRFHNIKRQLAKKGGGKI